ncbi:MAG TPA: APC family permease [Terriglobia bacterium]|nr:APC family permease [Terriglobia bacterium]
MGDVNSAAQTNSSPAQPRLRRVLTLWDLIFYGIVLIQPIAPVPLFGVVQERSHGHIVDTILIAMFAMMITAFSYGRMAALYPSAGSAYTYVGRGLNLHLGFLVGWAMFLDYLLQPLINAVWVAETIHGWVHGIPAYALMAAFIGAITFMNLRGIRASALANKLLLALMSVVIVAFVVFAVRHLFHLDGWGGIFSTLPFYDPKTFDFRVIRGAVPLAALTYIGFDGVTTLAEDVQNPKRNVLLATVLVCLFTGIFGGLEVYLGQRVWPGYHFDNITGAFMDVCMRVGGQWLFLGMTAVTVLAALGSALTGGLGAARLLFGMGRDNVLPRRVFGHLDPKRNTPNYNIWIIAVLAFGGGVVLSLNGHGYENAAELLNFGAFIAFMGVNFSTFWQFAIHRATGRRINLLGDILLPLFGFVFCGWIWLNLNIIAKVVGGIWFVIGIIYLGYKTRWFREKPVMIDFTES